MLAVQIGGIMMILAGIICYLVVKEAKHDVTDAELGTIEMEEHRPV